MPSTILLLLGDDRSPLAWLGKTGPGESPSCKAVSTAISDENGSKVAARKAKTSLRMQANQRTKSPCKKSRQTAATTKKVQAELDKFLTAHKATWETPLSELSNETIKAMEEEAKKLEAELKALEGGGR